MKKLIPPLILFLVSLICGHDCYGADDGSYLVRNFDPHDYNGGSKIYSIVTTSNGLLYAGDKSGLIEFDGENWSKILTGFPVYSLAIDKKNRIFIAGKDGIGFLKRDSLNEIKYHSLNYYVTGHLTSNTFKNSKVFSLKDETVYVVSNGLVVYSQTQIRILENDHKFILAQKVNDDLYLYSAKSGIYKYSDGELSPVLTDESIKRRHFWGFMSNDDGLVIFEDDRSYLIESVALKPVSYELNHHISDFVVEGVQQIDKSTYIFKTFYDGLLIVNTDMLVEKKIDQSSALINNTVFAVNSDQLGNLWVGTSSGMSVFRRNLPFTKYNTSSGIGTGYSAIKIKNDIYLGTSHGLWIKNKTKSDLTQFDLIFKGHVFGLSNVNDILYVGHPSGIYAHVNNKMKVIAKIPGGACIKKVPFEENKYVANTAMGLIVFTHPDKSGNGHLKFEKILQGKNSVNHNFEFDKHGNVWVEYDNGIYTFHWSYPDKKRYYTRVATENRLKRITKIKEEVYFVADSGLYSFDYGQDKFGLVQNFGEFKGGNNGSANLVSDNLGKLWLFTDGNLSQCKWQDGQLHKLSHSYFTYIDGSYPSDYENVYSIDDTTILIGCEQGFFNFKNKHYRHGIYSSVIIRDVKISSQDSKHNKVWGEETFIDNSSRLELYSPISYSKNSISFNFSAGSPNYNEVYYQTFLEGYNTKWSDWNSDNVKEYTNLSPGEYRFIVRAINESGEYSNIGICKFEILPPWYLTSWFRTVCVVLGLMFLIACIITFRIIMIRTQKKFERKQILESKRAEQKRLQEKLKQEKELVKLRNEKLKSDNLHKSKELANLTLSLIQKNQVLSDFKGDLEQIKMYSETNKLVTEDIRRLIRKVNRDIDKEENWEVFESYFDTVHENFSNKLKNKYPELTPKDLRLCAYLKMNLSTKEISPLMNISVRGVEIGRYRLRKKLNLDRTVNISGFLSKI